ncbi:hypothetical protein [Wolbachia endosymbiont (group A) of Myopa testacea]|uniref:TomO hydrophobic C-terminal domain-containing protein n=1 Tax=Wolbachia endosymbiont (group A) of Myopa testacea TaxID=3066148 RepID=UPI00333FB134
MDFNRHVKNDTLMLVLPTDTINANELISFLQSNTRITKLTLCLCFIDDRGAEVLANFSCLKRLKRLDLYGNKIGDEGAKALANSPYLTNLKELSLSSNKIGGEGIEALARSQGPKVKLDPGAETIFYSFLSSKKHSSNQVVDEENVRKMTFKVARYDRDASIIKYILTKPDKYPFLINSRDEEGYTLAHFYNHSPEMQKFLFGHGMIPEQERSRRDDARIARDSQSVHASPIVKRTNFFTRKLVEFMEASKEQLERAAVSYVRNIGLFKQYQNDPIYVQSIRLLKGYQNQNDSIKLRLRLTDNEKGSVMKKTLRETDPIPGDEEFIKTVIDKAKQALKQQYLKKNFRGEYDQGYPTQELQYDYTRDDAKITIPESIGYIKLLIDNFSVPLKEKKELLVTLMEQNPDLVKNKLSKVKEKLGNSVILDKEQFNKTELHGLLNGIDDGKKVDELFKEISCLNIEEVWREQKEFILLKQIYIAATTYGENSSACIQGTWTQIISSINEISSEIVAQYDRYLEEEQKQEMQKNAITKENIKPFLEGLADKLIQYVELHPELKETLEDFVVCIVEINKPEEITFEQQKILAEINKYFSENIKDALRNYNRNIPNRDEYGLIIEGLSKVKAMQDFAQEPSNQQENITKEVETQVDESIFPEESNTLLVPGRLQPENSVEALATDQKIGIQNNNQQPSKPNAAAPRSEKRTIIAASVLAIAGVALGITIAVYLEMLAVGVAVGVCCLIAAAIIYCCNQP